MVKYLDRDWLTLESAATRLASEGFSVHPDDVLHLAAKGKVRAYLRLREPINIQAIRPKLIPGAFPSASICGLAVIFSFVLLSRMDAWRLEAQGQVELLSIKQAEHDPLEPFGEPGLTMNWVPVESLIAEKSNVVVLTADIAGMLASKNGGATAGETTTEAAKRSTWPWGSHQTVLLVHLRDAAERWWTLFDPDDPTTAPTNEKVAKWLEERGVSARTATYMATILRADGLRSGPR